jgi:hypothetical protein
MKSNLKYHIVIIIAALLITKSLYSQKVGNEWINYDQQYFKIQVNSDGIFRVTYTQLLQAGVPVNLIDPRWIQIFHKGEEQYIYIQGEGTTGIFDPTGYIEFYGQRNRAELDLEFFDDPNNCVNLDYSIHNDTAAYFITWNNSISNRRMTSVNQTDYSPYIPNAQLYCYRNIRTNYTATYYWGSTRSLFTEGEGWFDNAAITEEAPRTKTISVPNIFSGSISSYFEIAVVGAPANQVVSSVPHHLKVNFLGQTRIDRTYSGYQFIRENITLPSSQLSSSISFVFSSNDITQPDIVDRNVVSYINIKYPHTWDFENLSYFEFFLPANSLSEKDYLEITNFSTGSTVYLYDISNHERISVQNSSGVLRTLVNNTDTERFLILTNQSGYKSVNSVSMVSSSNKFTNYESLYSNSDYLIITHKSLWGSAQDYADYRNSSGFNAALIDIDELYNQYAWGVNKHPVSMRNFISNLNEISQRPRLMFIIGKSIHFRLMRNNPEIYNECLVPSAGNPSSDNLITAGLDDTNYEPLVGTGRLSAKTNDQVYEYLDKVMQYESAETAEWMKTILHFGGGSNVSEQTTFAYYLSNYERIIEDTLFGGSVSTFLKNSSEPIQITQSDSIRNLINSGASLLTFFGHGSASGFDQDIDNPEAYENTGRYPFILANSCFSGDIHQRSQGSISEDWVHAQQKGSIGFLASVGDGLASYLNIYSTELYKNISYKSYNLPIGFQIKKTVEQLGLVYPDNPYIELTCGEITLHGDPALIINSHDKPDLTITADLIDFNPEEITTIIDSFDVRLVIKNLGRATTDTFLVAVTRTLPNGNSTVYNISVFGCNYRDTLYLKLPVERLDGPGLNSLSVFVDAAAAIDELNESNNQISINFLIKTGDLFPIYPYNYSIIPGKNSSLIASTGDPFLETSAYRFQIDSTDLFNSPILQSTIINSSGGVVSWNLPFDLYENRVYFWRVARNHSDLDSIVWKESSFIYIEGEEGWSQAHFFQFKEDKFTFVDYDRPAREFKFVDYPKELHCYNTGYYWADGYMAVKWTLDGSINNGLGDVSNCGTAAAMLVAVINPETLLAWSSDIQNFGHRNYPKCFSSNRVNYFFSFSTDAVSLDSMNNLINSVPDDYYILSYSWGNGNFSNWPANLKQTFADLGALDLPSVPNGNAYIFFTQKGIISSTREVYETTIGEGTDLFVNLFRDFDNGKITSVIVGPSAEWKSLNWEYVSQEDPSDDEVILNVYGIDDLGNETQVMSPIVPETFELNDLQDSIDYQQFPNLKLEFYSKDEISKTAAQLIKWQLRFVGVAETAVDPASGYYFCCDTVQEGDEISFSVATRNISTVDMDSLAVKYWIQDNNNEITVIDQKKLRPHPAGDIIRDTIVYTSLGLSGLNSIWVEFNPLNSETGTYFQPEQHHFNNIAVKYFRVNRDITNPLLDVSFDGRYIMNGELVSSKPEILIKLKDENRYLALNDTSLFRIYLTDLTTGIERRVYFGLQENPQETIEWIPASLPENSCKIIYNPIFTTDGTYRMRVQAIDVSGNESGDNDYIIDFEVVTSSSITQLLNYPNPFSTSTRFVFELTGSEVPDELRIDIYTITGKLVKVIYQDELGPIRIGKNITEYAWDGKDMYGDQLANGVYFYQVRAKINGEDIDHRATEADKYFKHEMGKMYLMR